jgi:predicted CxxxxCH...CXXCH cytochrome family protein
VVLVAASACAAERTRPDGEPSTGIHPPGILDLASDDFHGRELERRGWDLGICAMCHGDDFAGGTAKSSCNGCHREGPAACATCHRDGPTTGAHVAHRAGTACGECHVAPDRWDAEGHVRRDGMSDVPPAEVVFGGRAALTIDPADRAGPPEYSDGRCTNVYCHGDALHAGGGLAPRPRWDDPTPPGGCDRCHAAPPPSHAQDRCETCHPGAAPHIDGVVQIGRTAGCDGCHGSAASPAPPVDLAGNTFTTAIGVGAHQAHLQAPSRLRGPIACATCHRVPTQIVETDHLDSVAPAEVTATLGWDRGAARCSSAWCHGPAQPVWTETGGASCGTCHGVPPATASHAPDLPITSCAGCHPRTIDASGTILINAGASEHIDGDVDLL